MTLVFVFTEIIFPLVVFTLKALLESQTTRKFAETEMHFSVNVILGNC